MASLSDNVAKRPRCQISSMSTLSHSMNREYMRENMAKYTKIKLSSNTYCNNRTKWQQMESKDIEFNQMTKSQRNGMELHRMAPNGPKRHQMTLNATE